MHLCLVGDLLLLGLELLLVGEEVPAQDATRAVALDRLEVLVEAVDERDASPGTRTRTRARSSRVRQQSEGVEAVAEAAAHSAAR